MKKIKFDYQDLQTLLIDRDIVVGLKNVFVKMILWPGSPINGIVFGLLDGDDDGVIVKNIKLETLSVYLYLIALSVEFDKFELTDSQ